MTNSSNSLSAVVPESLAGERLDRAIALLADVSRKVAHTMIAQAEVRVDGEVATSPSRRLKVGESLEAALPSPEDPQPKPNIEVTFGVVYVDQHIVVVDKPAGLATHPGAGHTQDTLVNGLVARFPKMVEVGEPQRCGIVHRLDRFTSGLLVVARTNQAYEDLVAQMAARSPKRKYHCLVWGHMDAETGLIDAPIGRSIRTPTRMAVVDGAKPAKTHYQVVERFNFPCPLTFLECRLETGRTHQIRVHLQAIGHPIVGDGNYGGNRPQISLSRPFLHASELVLTHPHTKKPQHFTSPLPEDLGRTLAVGSR